MSDKMVENGTISEAGLLKSGSFSPLSQFSKKKEVMINEGALLPTLDYITTSYADIKPTVKRLEHEFFKIDSKIKEMETRMKSYITTTYLGMEVGDFKNDLLT